MRQRHFRFGLIAATLLLLGGCLSSSDNDRQEHFTLTLLHTNDLHSHLEPFGSNPEEGGIARIKTIVDGIRAERGTDNVLLVDAGDYFQGTLFFNAWRGSDSVMALNAIGYDIVTLGNHEFDLGPQGLARALRGDPIEIAGTGYLTEAIAMPVVITNLDYSAEPELASQGLLRDSVVIERGGRRFGILGMVTDTTSNISNPGPNIRFLDYVSSIQAEVDRLRADGVRKIIVLSHVNHRDDLDLARQLSGVNVILSGHDHVLLGDAEALAADPATAYLADQVAGPYPAVVGDRDGNTVLVVSALEYGRVVGRLDLTFDADGALFEWSGGPIPVNEFVQPDPGLARKVAEYRAPVDDLAGVVIGEAAVRFDGSRTPGLRTQEMPLGNLVADTLLAYARPAYGAVAALTNGGGIRATIEQGTVTFGDALAVLPFGNSIVTIGVTGEELVAALDNGLTWAYDPNTNATRSSGSFPQVSGMTATFCGNSVADIQAEPQRLPPTPCPDALRPGGVVTALSVAGEPVDAMAEYRIATNNFMGINGGDFYTMLAEACTRAGGFCEDSFVLMLDELVKVFETSSPVSRSVEGRLLPQ